MKRVSRMFAIPRRLMAALLATALCAGGMYACLLLARQTGAHMGAVTYSGDGKKERTVQLPMLTYSGKPRLTVRVPFVLKSLHPSRFLITVDDCLETLSINGVDVSDQQIPFCDAVWGRTIDLGKYVRPGVNMLSATIFDFGGSAGFDVRAARTDPAQIAVFCIVILLMGAYAWIMLYLLRGKPDRPLRLLLIAGCLLRFTYVLGTPYRTRAYDVDGHLDYIRYVLAYFRMPPAYLGWEYHQAPLYYFFAAVWLRMGQAWGFAAGTSFATLQWWSLLFSCVTLWGCSRMTRLLFARKDQRTSALLFLALLCVLPGLVFFASRISNEVLLSMFSFLSAWLLLRWWKTGRPGDWYLLCIPLSLACITKVNAYALLPAAGACLLMRRSIPWSKKIAHGLISGALVLAAIGWVPYIRLVRETNTARVLSMGNVEMDGGLRIKTSPLTFVTFNPAQVLRIPFNDTWSDDSRRRYFPEFFLRSMFFGEFDFDRLKTLAQLILLTSMACIPLFARGLWLTLRRTWYQDWPVLMLLAWPMAAAIAYPGLFPFSSNQDFRFSVILAVPFAYFLVKGTEFSRRKKLTMAARGIVAVCTLLCAGLLGSVYFL